MRFVGKRVVRGLFDYLRPRTDARQWIRDLLDSARRKPVNDEPRPSRTEFEQRYRNASIVVWVCLASMVWAGVRVVQAQTLTGLVVAVLFLGVVGVMFAGFSRMLWAARVVSERRRAGDTRSVEATYAAWLTAVAKDPLQMLPIALDDR